MLCTFLLGFGLLMLASSLGFAQRTDSAVFIHHSCGSNWLDSGLHDALEAKDYISKRNDIGYKTVLNPDPGRPASLGEVPGDNTNMNHWILWFNDYLGQIQKHGCDKGINRIVMFKSCYPISNVGADGTASGDPFDAARTLANYKAVYRHTKGPGNTYTHDGQTYEPLEDVFAAHPDTLFLAVTAPPRHYAPVDKTTDADARRARQFNTWLKSEWLSGYNIAHPGLHNVAVFDWFDVIAYPDNHAQHPNRLRSECGGESGDSHPSEAANKLTVQVFATNPDNFIDAAWRMFCRARGSVKSSHAQPASASRKP